MELAREELAKKLKEDFPIFKTGSFAYLDNAATTQKPKQVLEAMEHYYHAENANPAGEGKRLKASFSGAK